MHKRLLISILTSLLASPALAAFHLMQIAEIYPGSAAAPSAQFIVLQMYAAGQQFVMGHPLVVYNAAGTPVATFTFPANMPNGPNQAKILIATTQASTTFGLTADMTMTAVIPLAGGKVCFDSFDCAAWGNYSASSAGVGTPFNAAGGLVQGQSMRRKLGANGMLDSIDDTNNCASDFEFARPAPRNNAGQGCGNGSVDPFEQCDDGNTSNSDGCLGSCATASCGDGYVRTGVEQCDDGNASNTDACLNTCTNATCGDGFTRTAFEECDDANASNTDACIDGCVNATCGDGFTRTGVEECDDANGSNTDACPGCSDAECGDGFTWLGFEQCDDGNASNLDQCVNTCAVAFCGDGFVRKGIEECDDSNASNTDECVDSCVGATCGDGFVWDGVEECDDGNTSGGDACPANCGPGPIPQETSAGATLRASRSGGSVAVTYTPACGADDHAVYWGTSPIVSSLNWTTALCSLGVSGSTSFPTGTPPAGHFLYFVLVGYNAAAEGSYGVDSSNTERPEATGIGSCDQPRMLGGTCP